MNTFESPVPNSPPRNRAQGKNRLIVFLDIFLLVASIANGVTTLIDGLETRTIQAYASSSLSFLLITLYIASLIAYQRGKHLRAAWMTIIGIQITMLLTISLYSGISVFSIGLQLLLTTLLALTIFTTTQTTIAIAFVMIGGFLSILMDMEWPLPRATANTAMTTGMAATLVVIAIFYVGFIIRRFRGFSLYVKLLLAFSFISIFPAVTLGIINANTLSKALNTQASNNLHNAAAQTAISLDAFFSSSLSNIRVEANYPSFGKYMDLIISGEQIEPTIAEEAATVLAALQRKDPVFVLSYALLTRNGENVLDTAPENIGGTEYQYEYFYKAISLGLPYVTSVVIPSDDHIPSIFFSSPIRNSNGEMVGVLRARYDASILQQIVGNQNDRLEQAFALLIDDEYILLANGLDPFKLQYSLKPLLIMEFSELQITGRISDEISVSATEKYLLPIPDLVENLEAGNTEFTIVTTELGVTDNSGQAAAVSKMSTQPWSVVFLQPQSVFLNPLREQIRNIVFIIIATIIIGTAIGIGITSLITSPLQRLTEIASRIEQGDLEAVAEIKSTDEIGALSVSFNSMTARLRDLVTGLEKRVAERTLALEQRAQQIQTAADVGSVAARIRDINVLLPQTAQLIAQRFGFYHVGIFLLDDKAEYAILNATNSEGGQRMLARGHKLSVGKVGIVGFVTATGQARIALDVGQDAIYFDNPDLPDTRSEMAIPLSIGNKILGALDVQSTEEAAFSDDDVVTLKVLADQLSIAIENANLFAETQSAAETARRAYGEVSIRDWQKMLREKQEEIGYVSIRENQAIPVSGEVEPGFTEAIETGKPALNNNGTTLYVPIAIRGKSIGAIQMDKPQETVQWTQNDIATASSLAEQLSTALESARLYGDASRRATREQLISEISAKIGATMRMDTIITTAIEEVGRAFSDSEVILQVGNFETEEKPND